MTFTHYALRQLRTQMIAYGVGLGLYAAMIALLFPAMEDTLAEIAESYPPEILDAFGVSGVSLADPRGFFSAEFFSFAPVIFAAFGLFAGTGALAGEEGSGTLELIAALPVSRRELFLRRVAAIAIGAVAIATIIALGWIATLPFIDLGGRVTLLTVVWATYAQLSFVAFIVAAGLLLGAVAPSRGSAASWTAVLLVASYLIVTVAGAVEVVRWTRYASPYYYTDLSQILVGGIVPAHAAALWTATAAIGALALRAFERREFSGNGWQIAALAFWRGN